jgi:hypothetical protein
MRKVVSPLVGDGEMTCALSVCPALSAVSNALGSVSEAVGVGAVDLAIVAVIEGPGVPGGGIFMAS